MRTSPTIYTRRIVQAAACMSLTSALVGCGSVQKSVDQVHDTTVQNIAQAKQKAEQTAPIVTSTPASWLLGQSVQVAPTPSPILLRHVAYRPTQKVSLVDVAAWVTTQTGLAIDVAEIQASAQSSPQANAPLGQGMSVGGAPGMMGSPPTGVVPFAINPSMGNMAGINQGSQSNSVLPLMSFNADPYEGPLSGLLDIAANKSGVWWKFHDGSVTFFRTETRTFYLPAISQVSSGSSGISANTSGGGTAGGGGGASGSATTGANTSSTTGGAANNSQYTVDIWKDMEKTALAVAGAGATVVANASIGSVTVTGTPKQVRTVEAWAKALADNLSQQVTIDVRIYKVKVSNEDNFNWSPGLVFKSLSNVYGLNVTPPGAPGVASGTSPMNLAVNILSTATGEAAQWSGSQLAFQALSTLGKVTETVQQSVVTPNGQPAAVQIANAQAYVASITQGTTSTTGTVTGPTLTPGTLTTGFTAMFLPRVVNGKVLLVMNLTSSALMSMGKADSGGSSIQTPNVDLSIFQQSVSLTPGDALMLTGLQKDNGASTRNGTFSPTNYALGGGYDDASGKTLIAIVITAKVL